MTTNYMKLLTDIDGAALKDVSVAGKTPTSD
jgi:hypothetical protein